MTNKLPKHPEEPWDVQRSHPHRYHDLHHVAPECDDQLALISGVGRGLRGDSYRIDVIDKDNDETYLQGKIYDAATNTWVDDWLSDNVNGGYLTAYITTNETTDPPTFTLTFEYSRPVDGDDAEPIKWTKTTPAIPYVIDPAPDGAVDFIDLAKILGLTEQNLQDILNDVPGVIVGDGFTGDNIKDYIDNKPTGISQAAAEALIDDAIDDLSDHIHEDMGFGTLLINDGNSDTKNPKRNTIKKWLDWMISQMGFGGDINNFDSTGATTIKQYIKNLRDYIATQLGFGDNINQFGSSGATTVKEYIQYLIDNIKIDIEDPKLYTKSIPCTLVRYSLPRNAGPNVTGIPISIPESSITDASQATLMISYFNMLPSVDVSIQISNNDPGFFLPTGDMAIVCEAHQSGQAYKPLNLQGVVLDNRSASQSRNMKAPVLNPENMSNSGYGTANPAAGNWQVYTGIGNVKTIVATADPVQNGGWPWYKVGSNTAFYAYLFNRSTGWQGPDVHMDYARIYSCRYDMATETSI